MSRQHPRHGPARALLPGQGAHTGLSAEDSGVGWGRLLWDAAAMGAVTRHSETQRAGGSVHRNAMVWVIPWEFAREAGFTLLPYELTADKALSKFFRWISSPCRFSAADSKPCFLVFSPLMEMQPQVPPQPILAPAWSKALSSPALSAAEHQQSA